MKNTFCAYLPLLSILKQFNALHFSHRSAAVVGLSIKQMEARKKAGEKTECEVGKRKINKPNIELI